MGNAAVDSVVSRPLISTLTGAAADLNACVATVFCLYVFNPVVGSANLKSLFSIYGIGNCKGRENPPVPPEFHSIWRRREIKDHFPFTLQDLSGITCSAVAPLDSDPVLDPVDSRKKDYGSARRRESYGRRQGERIISCAIP